MRLFSRRILLWTLLPALLAARPADADVADLVLELVATGFSNLVDITHAGDGRLFVAEQDGQILIYDGGSFHTFLDISPLIQDGFEGGIKSVAFHPGYSLNGFFYVHYSDSAGDSVVARYEVSAGDPNTADHASGLVLFTVAQTTDLHRGGQLAFGPDGDLYTSLGDGGPQADPDCHAQDPADLRGKLLRLDADAIGARAPGTVTPEVRALGLRNPWRFSFDRLTGDLYLSDVGQDSREEINLQPAGAPEVPNYGWRVMEGTACHDPDPVDADCPPLTPSCGDPSYTPPILDYARAGGHCSVTGGYVYRGRQIASLFGRYLYGDWCSGTVWAADDASGSWTGETLPVSLGGLTTFGEDRDGNLYLTNGGSIFRLDDPTALFFDGFETGDASTWSQTVGAP